MGCGYQAQCPFRSHEQTSEVVFRIVVSAAAGVNHAPISQHNFETHDVVGRDTIFEAVWPAGVFAQVAADGTRAPTGRIRRIIQSFSFDEFVERQMNNTWLNNRRSSGFVQIQHLLHASERNHYPTLSSNRSAAQTRSCAARHHRQAVLDCPFHCGHNFVNAADQHNALRPTPPQASINFVGDQLHRIGHQRIAG